MRLSAARSLVSKTFLQWFLCSVFVLASFSPVLAEPTTTKPNYSNDVLLNQMVIVDVSEQVLDTVPALTATFSQNVNSSTAFDSFFTVTQDGKQVPGGWVLAENPRKLYFTHIQPSTSYRVQIRPGLESSNGLKLQSPSDFSVETRAIQPTFDFASRGNILPTRLTQGLPIRVVNIPELDIEFLRVQPDKLGTLFKSLPAGGTLQTWDLEAVNEVTESVYSTRYVTDAKTNARETRVIPVEDIPALQQPGVYFAVMRQPGRFSDSAYRITYFIVTNIGLHARVYADRVELFAHALDSGQALENVALTLQGEEASLEAQTDVQGHAAFSERPKGSLFVTAKLDNQFALLDLRGAALDLSDYAVTGSSDQPIQPFMYSSRDLYRPGEGVDLSVLLRNRDGLVEPIKTLNLRILRPDTRIVQELTLTPQQAALGYFAHHFQIPKDAATGSWRAEIRLAAQDEAALTMFRFQVEEFQPERMKLELRTAEPLILKGQKLTVSVQGDYLYGAPAAGNTVKTVRQLSLNRHPLDAYQEFYFGNPADEQYLKSVDLPDVVLNEQGGGFIEVPAVPEAVTSPLTIKVMGSLLESSGRSVTRSLREAFWPEKHLVGIRPLFSRDIANADSVAEFEIAKVNLEGQLVAANQLAVTLVREEFEYFWEYNESEGWRRKEVRNEYPLTQQQLILAANTAGRVSFPVSYGRYRIEVEDPETQLKTVYGFSAGWQDQPSDGMRPDQIELKLDKAAYKAGDIARLQVNSPFAGQALLTVEGSELLWLQSLNVAKGESVLEVPIKEEWNRHDLYISVTAFRPANAQDNIAPNRALGLIYLPLDRSDRQLQLSIEAPEKAQPEQAVKITVKANDLRSSQAMVTVAAVDVGVLNMTGFTTPNPFDFYFSRHAYSPNLYDDYGKVIESVKGAALRQRFGGDGGTGSSGLKARADVQIVSLFSGLLSFDAEGKSTIDLMLPAFDGRLRLMAVAFGEQQLGSAEREMQVAAPVVTQLGAPIFLASGDSTFLTVELNNTTEQEQVVRLEVNANSLLDFVSTDQNYTLTPGKREILRLPFAARQVFGTGQINLRLTGKDFIANRNLNVAVRPAYPSLRKQYSAEIAPNSSFHYGAELLAGLQGDSLQARLTLSNAPPLPVASALEGLLQYPYGCLEQVTSGAYPYLYLDNAMSEQWGLATLSMEERNQRVQAALVRISGMQQYNGSFALWGGYGQPDEWLTAYVTNFLLDARQQGFQVPDKLLQQALKYLEEKLQEGLQPPNGLYPYSDNPVQTDLATRAFGAYVLARENRAPLGSLRNLYDQEGKKATIGLPLVHLGMALTLQGDKRRGDEAIQRGLSLNRPENLYLGDYGSPIRDRSLMLVTLLSHNQKVSNTGEQVNGLVRDLQSRTYLSTQEQVAIFLLGRLLNQQATQVWKGELQVAGLTQTLNQAGTVTRTLSAQDLQKGITLLSQHATPLYANLTIEAYPLGAPAARDNPIRIQRSWYNLQGREIQPADVKVGDLVLVRVAVQSTEIVRDALLVDLLPSGFEIENTNLVENELLQTAQLEGMRVTVAEWVSSNPIEHEEFREDRYVAALPLNEQGMQYAFYMMRAMTPTHTTLPPPYILDMYRPDRFGIGATAGQIHLGK